MLHLRVVTDTAKKPVRDTGRAAASLSDLTGPVRLHLDIQKLRRPADNLRKFLDRIELQLIHNAETGPERVREHAGAGCRADQRERRKIELDRAGSRPLADHDVNLEIFQRRVKDFLDDRGQTMNFIDEEDVPLLEIRKDGGKIPGALKHGA